ncbi:FtsQ-type POTRA domain-containing protein [Spirulina subsalsa FACHB-351]|uniref:FtsQ-type POTRA domain-containing protein n=1 Tax=Spirulina subsalsa FACHB-351 TaxID=234711 RepID=A0ABT3L9F8_9CYAN|nr:FtsQ-type POTRA domain-containing protein [Spirulina subsalsa]MCW6037734.1 FtsQ-type POTRA domain-containing protein [Spirulina subsalsa FACHB-351]
MTVIASISSNDLKSRRQQLKRRRQVKLIQTIWRSLFVGSLTGGLVWVVTLPNWVIYEPDQVEIEGNHLLPVAAIRSLLPLDYPQPIIELEPQKLTQEIEAIAPIAKATVTRKLLPPSLTVIIQERRPVAIARSSQPSHHTPGELEMGFIDAEGVWLPKSSYGDLDSLPDPPKLVVVGLTHLLLPYWSEIYQNVQRSTVQIQEINLQSPGNLTLTTEIGKVHLGAYNSNRFPEQLRVLAEMRDLPTHIQDRKIRYIDLSSPDSPSIELD